MERVIQLISQIGGVGDVAPDEGIYDAGFSSARVLELILALEQEFNISIPDEDFVAATTPRKIAELVGRLLETRVT